MVITVVLTSCYFFPFVLGVLPIANSKMILALLGLIMFGINLAKKGNAGTNFDFVQLSAWALVISLIAYASITINNTPDATFVSHHINVGMAWRRVFHNNAYKTDSWKSISASCSQLYACCMRVTMCFSPNF